MRGAASGGRVWGLVILGGLLALAGCTTPAGRPSLPSAGALEADPLTGGDVPIPRSNVPGAAAPARDELKAGLVPEAGASTSPAALARGPGASPAVGAPQPKTPPAGDPGIVQAGATVPAPAGEDTYEQLQEKLKARGVVWQRLKNDNDRLDAWTFDCAIPDRDNRDIRRVYLGEGAGPQAAMRAALEQIDRDKR